MHKHVWAANSNSLLPLILSSLPSPLSLHYIPVFASVCVCVCDLRMLCVCLSDAELIEVIGGAHAEAERWQKKAHSFEPSPCSAHCQKISPPSPSLSLSHHTLITHTNTHTGRHTCLICDQTEAFNPRILVRLCICVYSAVCIWVCVWLAL